MVGVMQYWDMFSLGGFMIDTLFYRAGWSSGINVSYCVHRPTQLLNRLQVHSLIPVKLHTMKGYADM